MRKVYNYNIGTSMSKWKKKTVWRNVRFKLSNETSRKKKKEDEDEWKDVRATLIILII
jgi:hypothetical protein